MSKLARLQFVLAIVEFTLIPSFLVIFYTLIKIFVSSPTGLSLLYLLKFAKQSFSRINARNSDSILSVLRRLHSFSPSIPMLYS